MIVTLAGHVDHGKTTLVRLLTGKDTDRLIEEKRRGLTIDLGFAYLEGDGVTLGFVDVPGHHRFIHNMVAGVAAGQHALLVVAADDGPMPQSREHLQILELLGVTDGVIALSKADRVTAGRLADASAEVAALVAGSFLENAPIIETSAATGAGLDVLRRHLLTAASRRAAALQAEPFRLAVDRTFVLQGAGLVVTGTVHGGTATLHDELHVFPLGCRGRLRDLRVQDRAATAARAGDRAAINLAGPGCEATARGHWLCSKPEPGHTSLVLDLEVLADFPRDVRHWTPVHVYHATSHATGRLALLQHARLGPGERGWAELVLDAPLLGKRGDRVVVRDQALERTLGGGAVIDNRPPAGRRRAPARLAAIEACTLPTPRAALDALLGRGPVDARAFRDVWNLADEAFEALTAGTDAELHDGMLIARPLWQQWRAALLDECRRRHLLDPALQGLRENELAAPGPAEFRALLLAELTAAGQLVQRAGRYSPRHHQAELSAAERQLFDRLKPRIDHTQPPSLGDIARELRIPLDRLKMSVRSLVSKGVVVQVSDKRIYLPRHLETLAGTAERLGREQQTFSAREFRDAAGIGRNVAIEVLEYFDVRGFTRRQGESRRVVGERARLTERDRQRHASS